MIEDKAIIELITNDINFDINQPIVNILGKNSTNYNDETFFKYAIKNFSKEDIINIINKSLNKNILKSTLYKDNKGKNYLIDIIERKDPDIFYNFIKKIFSCEEKDFPLSFKINFINFKDNSNKSPLMYAVEANNMEFIECLISLGADLYNIDNNGQNIIAYACKNNNNKILTLLLKSIDFNKRKEIINHYDNNRYIPLIYSIENNNLEAIYIIMQYGADLNRKIFNNMTPLMYAIDKNNIDIISALLSLNVDIYSIDDFGRNIIMHASFNRNIEILILLLNRITPSKKYKMINCIDNMFNTPLINSIKLNDFDSFNALIEHGANINQFEQEVIDNNNRISKIKSPTPILELLQHNPNNLEMLNELINRGKLDNKNKLDFYADDNKIINSEDLILENNRRLTVFDSLLISNNINGAKILINKIDSMPEYKSLIKKHIINALKIIENGVENEVVKFYSDIVNNISNNIDDKKFTKNKNNAYKNINNINYNKSNKNKTLLK